MPINVLKQKSSSYLIRPRTFKEFFADCLIDYRRYSRIVILMWTLLPISLRLVIFAFKSFEYYAVPDFVNTWREATQDIRPRLLGGRDVEAAIEIIFAVCLSNGTNNF